MQKFGGWEREAGDGEWVAASCGGGGGGGWIEGECDDEWEWKEGEGHMVLNHLHRLTMGFFGFDRHACIAVQCWFECESRPCYPGVIFCA